ncbi:MAG: hypothetical protein LBC52_01480 [Treponema sp.]|jgi:hypothetical protein|nr:hypothetical protein [Treponema sp.]
MSDDDKEKKRPNAKYKLSHEKVQGTEVVYHYSRERRLEKSSQAVRDLYTEPPRRRFGFLHALTSNRPNAMLFGTIIFLCAVMLIFSYFGMAGDSRELDGNLLSVKGKNYEGTILIEVKKTHRKNKFARGVKPYTGAVDIAVFLPAKSGQTPQPSPQPSARERRQGSPLEQSQQPTTIFQHKIFFTNEQEEHYFFTVPFDQNELALIFRTEKKTLSMTIQIAGNR